MKTHHTIDEILEQRKKARKYAESHIEKMYCGCKNGNGSHYSLIVACTSSSYNREIGGLTVVSHYRCPKCGYTMRTEHFDGELVLRKITKE